ncbi:MAG: gliding motility-associated C-terminal domain-containing protein [Flavobacteriales bacterium]|nr:gliding motility-associated C-terminal domain-containing protein [Flavobacteriales bacterium]
MRIQTQIALLLLPLFAVAQDEFVINNGTDIRINPGCQVIFAEGGIQNASGELSNAGEVVVEGNIINSGTLSGGATSGIFRVLNDVENNGLMQPGQSLFELYGDAQFLRGSQQLDFYDLTLTGSGIKYMQKDISTAGTLDLTDRELRAASHTVYHTNTSAATVLAIHNEGFISADAGGGLSRMTNSSQDYFFPVGSTVNNFKIRPVTIAPQSGNNTYKVRYVPGPTPNATQRGAELYYVNPIFYHQVEATEGFSSGALTVFYEESEDGLFETLAHLESDFWRENAGTEEGPLLGSGPELTSYKTISWDFSSPEIALAAYSTELFVPNVFSPNEDGHNDVFKPRGTEPFDYELRIYDRWGNLVFTSDEIDKGWDGTFRGKAMNSAVFVYYVLSGDQVIDKGNVTLLR